MSSLTIFFGYIATCMLLYVFFHYKFLKILDVCTVFCLRHVPANKAAAVAAAAAVVHRAAAQKGDGPMGHAAAAQQQPAAPAPRSRTVWDIPGPAVLPLLGTKWVFLWKYSMTQLHKVYAGECTQIGKKSVDVLIGFFHFFYSQSSPELTAQLYWR